MDLHPLRQWRRANGKTLADVGRAAGAHASQLSEIERWRKRPSLKLAVRLSKATNDEVPVEKFVEPETASGDAE